MNPTQEQIEAALAYAEYKETNDTLLVLNECIPSKPRQGFHMATRCNIILAAAYRELKEAIKITIIENLHLADGDDCTLKRLKDAIKFELPEEL